MRDGIVNIGAASPNVSVAAPEKNAEAIIGAVRNAAERNIKILVTPELSLSAYTCQDLFFSESLLDRCEREINHIAEVTSGCDVLFFVGMPIRASGKLYNCAVAISEGNILGAVPKVNIPNYGEFYEARHFAPAPDENS